MKAALLLLLLLFIVPLSSHAQQKKLWAASFIDKKAPEFIVEDWLTDKPDMKGKFILIDFWATWCGPCRKAIPDMNAYHQKFKDQLVVVGLSDESPSVIKKMKSPTMKYYSAYDTKRRLNKAYKVSGIPHCVIIDPNGIVVWEGWPQQRGYELTEKVIEDLLKK